MRGMAATPLSSSNHPNTGWLDRTSMHPWLWRRSSNHPNTGWLDQNRTLCRKTSSSSNHPNTGWLDPGAGVQGSAHCSSNHPNTGWLDRAFAFLFFRTAVPVTTQIPGGLITEAEWPRPHPVPVTTQIPGGLIARLRHLFDAVRSSNHPNTGWLDPHHAGDEVPGVFLFQ